MGGTTANSQINPEISRNEQEAKHTRDRQLQPRQGCAQKCLLGTLTTLLAPGHLHSLMGGYWVLHPHIYNVPMLLVTRSASQAGVPCSHPRAGGARRTSSLHCPFPWWAVEPRIRSGFKCRGAKIL